MKRIENILEEIKQQGNYAVTLIYGEDIGCDDSMVDQQERNIKILMTPVGYLGEVRKLWKGKLKDLYDYNFNQEPKQISNPPQIEEYENDGYYIWGTDSAMAKNKGWE